MDHYDALPYESLPVAETHPQRMAVLARLFGIDAAPAQGCRVLDLGSAAGGNLIPMAWYQPHSEFIGVDLELTQVQDGQRVIDELGLKNIRLLQGDILHLGEELGDFDYIIAHGVYSWVPDVVREALLALCKNRLRPNGIAYISYNTQPGWRMRGMLRDMLLYHVRDIKEPLARLNTARRFIDLLTQTLPHQSSLQAQYLLEEAKYLQNAHPSYVYHEFLEENNNPEMFTAFAARAERHGLRYLCESQLATMFASALGPEAETFLDEFADMLEHEQYLDFLLQRTFRQSLLCHAQIEPDYDVNLGCLDDWACCAQLVPPQKLELRSSKPQNFTSTAGKQYSVSDPLLKTMLRQLCDSYPDAVAIEELLVLSRQQLPDAVKNVAQYDQDAWRVELFNLFVNQAVQLVLEPVQLLQYIGEKPCVNPLVRTQACAGNNLASVWHEIVYTDAFSQRLISYLDGNHEVSHLPGLMLQDIESGALEVPGLNRQGVPHKQLIAQVGLNIKRLLELFARNGLLQAAS